jgi:hypothetical protein
MVKKHLCSVVCTVYHFAPKKIQGFTLFSFYFYSFEKISFDEIIAMPDKFKFWQFNKNIVCSCFNDYKIEDI